MPEVLSSPEQNSRLNPHWTNKNYYVLSQLRKSLESIIAEDIIPNYAGPSNLLTVDLGCGEMPYRSLFLPLSKQYLGIDIPENNLADLHLDPQTGQTGLEPESVDLIVSTQVLEHVTSPSRYLQEAHRICKKEGTLILSTHGYWEYHPTPTDYWRWTGVGLKKTLEDNHWDVVKQIGILGFSPASFNLWRASLTAKLPNPLKRAFLITTHPMIPLLDRLYSSEEKRENAAVYVITARPRLTN